MVNAEEMTDRYWQLKAQIKDRPYCWQKDCKYRVMHRCMLLKETERECRFRRSR